MGSGIPIGINTRHPLYAGLAAAYLPSAFPGGPIVNLAAPGTCDLITRTGTGLTNGFTPDGMGVAFSGTSAAECGGLTPTSGGWRDTTGQSVFVRGMKTATPGSNTPTLLVGLVGTVSPFNVYGIGFGGASLPNNIAVYQTSTSAAQQGAITLSNNLMFDAVATMVPGVGVGPSLWVNGVKDTVAATTTVNITYPGTVSTYLGQQNSGRTAAATINVGYIWQRRLVQDQEARYLHANPYCLFLWESDLLMAQIVGKTVVVPPATTSTNFLLTPLLVGGGALEWLGRRKIKLRQLRGE
jgi:hypothetical protein